jgi:hypothetical protein
VKPGFNAKGAEASKMQGAPGSGAGTLTSDSKIYIQYKKQLGSPIKQLSMMPMVAVNFMGALGPKRPIPPVIKLII